MKYIASRTEMQRIDAYSIENIKIPGIVLMEKAAMAIEEELVRRFSMDKRFLIVTEKGNNGGDGLALARMLIHRGYQAEIYEIGAIPKETESYQIQKNILQQLDIPVETEFPAGDYDVIVDCIFGVGLTRNVAGVHAQTVDCLNAMKGFKVAVDVPSGVDASSGKILGTAFQADLTITIGLNKTGLLFYPGAACAGEIVVKDIGFPEKAIHYVAPKAVIYDEEDLGLLPERKAWSNKGTYGRILLIAGSVNMAGAAYLAALAAYRAGAGLVRIFTCEENRVILQTRLPDAIMTTYSNKNDALHKLEEAISWADAIGFGPGLGVSETGAVMLEEILAQAKVPLIIDADGINILAKMRAGKEHNERAKRIWQLYEEYQSGIILTPHMKEMERLTGIPIRQIAEDRINIIKETADSRHIVALKDARTLVSDGSEITYINVSGNHGMSVAGSGDVLLGITTAFVAVGDDLLTMARLGVFCHGKAGDAAAKRLGHHAMMAEDLANHLSEVLS